MIILHFCTASETRRVTVVRLVANFHWGLYDYFPELNIFEKRVSSFKY